VFDDSKTHGAFNNSDEERIVLIVDLIRPDHIPLGRAKGEP
jgi:aspartyl/asparaginyl beta-hydroxylase (cupin superfamily)